MEVKFDDKRPPNYQHVRPFRFVMPYDHEFRTHCKKRWIKRKLIDILVSQFRAYDKDYYLRAIEQGRLTINDKPTQPGYVMRDNDLLVHRTLRVQPPVLDLEVKIISEDADFVCVNKPPGITIHTGGGYHYNTLLALMYFELKKKDVYLLHRLDKCTSGVILFAKNKETSLRFHEQNSKFVMKKMYYARVQGDFDDKKYALVDMPLVCLSFKEGIYCVFEKDKHADDPAYTKELPKQSQTQFRKLWYDEESDSSLVECFPKTGRTHQIRVHLKYTGHPIINDCCYGGRFVGNLVLREKYGRELYKEMLEGGKVQMPKLPTLEAVDDFEVKDQIKKKVRLNDGSEKLQVPIQAKPQGRLDDSQWDFATRSMEICLHSHQYKFEDKTFESPLPYWCQKRALD